MSRLDDLVAFSRELSAPIWTAMASWSAIDQNSLKLPFVYLSHRALNIHEGIVVLAERGLGLEAGMLLRSLIEIGINVRWMWEDHEKRARRWLDYDWLATKKWRGIADNPPWPRSS